MPQTGTSATGPVPGFGSAFLAAGGLGLAVAGLAGLPDAYEQRQSSGEGVPLYFPGFLMVSGGTLALVAVSFLAWVAHRRPPSERAVPLLAAGFIVAALVVCVVVALYIESRYPVPG